MWRRGLLRVFRPSGLQRVENVDAVDPTIALKPKLTTATQEELLYELGITKQKNNYTDEYNKHQQLISFAEFLTPRLSNESFVAPCATLSGCVEVWDRASIWYRVTIRADTNLVRIGHCTNIQDGTVIEELPDRISPDHDGSTIIGHYTTIGHNCKLKACTVEDNCHIGMGSILSPGSYMEHGSMLGARTVVAPFQRIPHGQLWVGNPARYLRDVTDEEHELMEETAKQYYRTAMEHRDQFYLAPTDIYHEAESKGFCVGVMENPVALEKLKELRAALQRQFNATQQ